MNSPEMIIDWTGLQARYGATPAFLDRLLSLPAKHYSNTPAQLRAASGAGDLGQLRELAHSMKGMAGNLLAEPLRAAAEDAEIAAREGRAADAAALANLVADQLERLLQEIAARPPRA